MKRIGMVALAASVLAVPTLAAVAPPRLLNPGAWLRDREPPAGSLAQGERAMTALDLTIAPDGSVVTCDIALSSKSVTLDQYACSLFIRNAHYEPLTGSGDDDTLRKRRDFWIWDAPKSADTGSSKASAAKAGSDAGTWVTTDDLLKVSLAQDQVVVSNVLLAISPEGRVTACNVTLPSDRPDLDGRACDLMLARARYKPARDADGKPIMGVDWKTIRWQVPKDRSTVTSR